MYIEKSTMFVFSASAAKILELFQMIQVSRKEIQAEIFFCIYFVDILKYLFPVIENP